jgi:nicotinate-nucleotide adenylyltransferase
MRRIGLFGGTFDPIHIGHLDVIDAAAQALNLDDVLVMPANVPPHRASPLASGPHRFAMAALAIVDRAMCTLSDVEMTLTSPSFTSSTVSRLEQLGIDAAGLFVITGADAFKDIATWKGYPELLDRCHFVAVSRPSLPAPRLRHVLPALSGRMIDPASRSALADGPRIVLVDSPTAPVSSTDIRARLAAGDPIAGMVPPLVERHIEKHQLYKERSPVYGQI